MKKFIKYFKGDGHGVILSISAFKKTSGLLLKLHCLKGRTSQQLQPQLASDRLRLGDAQNGCEVGNQKVQCGEGRERRQ